MRSKILGILVGFAIVSFVYSIMLSCGKTPTETGNAGENGVVRVVYEGTGSGTFEVSIPEITLADPPALTGYINVEGEWRDILGITISFPDTTGVAIGYSVGYSLQEGSLEMELPDTLSWEYKVVVIK